MAWRNNTSRRAYQGAGKGGDTSEYHSRRKAKGKIRLATAGYAVQTNQRQRET